MDERGFTLVELLTVMLIIAALSAIALPAFLGQADKAHDANVKADLRNAVSQMETCFAEPETFDGCPDADHQLPVDVAAVVAADGTGYTVTKQSQSGTFFTIERGPGPNLRTCTVPGEGGCPPSGSW